MSSARVSLIILYGSKFLYSCDLFVKAKSDCVVLYAAPFLVVSRGGTPVSGFEATPAELQVCGSTLSQIEQEVSAQLRSLNSEVDGLLTGAWQGAAANGFAAGWHEWSAAATDLLAALGGMEKLLGRTGCDYQDSDEDARHRVWQSGRNL